MPRHRVLLPDSDHERLKSPDLEKPTTQGPHLGDTKLPPTPWLTETF